MFDDYVLQILFLVIALYNTRLIRFVFITSRQIAENKPFAISLFYEVAYIGYPIWLISVGNNNGGITPGFLILAFAPTVLFIACLIYAYILGRKKNIDNNNQCIDSNGADQCIDDNSNNQS